jgi:hypothetical protein
MKANQNQEIFARYMNDQDFAKVVADYLRKQVYEQIRTEVKQDPVQQAPDRTAPETRRNKCGRKRTG